MKPTAFLIAAASFLIPAVAAGADNAREPYLLGHTGERTYYFYLNEERLVESHCQWDQSGRFTSEYTIETAGQRVTTRMQIESDSLGRWAKIDMDTPMGPVVVQRQGDSVGVLHEGKEAVMFLPEGTMLFENFSPMLIELIVETFADVSDSEVTFPLFIVPHAVMNGSLKPLGITERTLGNRDLELRRYTLSLPGVDVILYVDEIGRMLLGEVPAQHGAYVLEGYEGLLRAPSSDPLISKPQYDVQVSQNVPIPMRDGTVLRADIYLPEGAGPAPAILVRTPYKKELNELEGRFYARRGYAYVVQDCRGRFASEGDWEPLVHEGKDGFDTIEWVAKQPWCNGKVGTIGASYLGWVQWMAAAEKPPHLVTMVPNVSPPEPLYNIPYEYGTFFLFGSIWWADVLESEATADISGAKMYEIGEKKYGRLLRSLPVIDLDRKVLGKKSRFWRQWIKHPPEDPYWEPMLFSRHLAQTRIPVFHQSGWFDGDGIGSKLNYAKMRALGHPYQKLVLGPWGHTAQPTRMARGRDFGPEAVLDLQALYLRWMDHWLKGVQNGIEKEPMVSLFVMGANRWIHCNSYPPPQAVRKRLYLHSRGHANTSRGDGWLAFEPPEPGSPPDEYVYDPGDPTPAPYLYLESEQESAEEERGRFSMEERKRRRQRYYAILDSTRDDILVYETSPLEKPLTFAGPIEARLYASTTARDTDWFIRLSEVSPEGKIFMLVEGRLRARYRNGNDAPSLLTPGVIYCYTIDMWQTAIRLEQGSRLRVEIASASFPAFSRNLNTGRHNETGRRYIKARQRVFHDPEHPSYVLLPVLERFDGESNASMSWR